jgi:hypothetical protein
MAREIVKVSECSPTAGCRSPRWYLRHGKFEGQFPDFDELRSHAWAGVEQGFFLGVCLCAFGVCAADKPEAADADAAGDFVRFGRMPRERNCRRRSRRTGMATVLPWS